MKNLKWVIAIVLVAAIAASAWWFVSRRPERAATALPPEERSAAVELSRFLPTGAVAVGHYSGGETLQPAYEKSALGQIISDPQMQEFLRKPTQSFYRAFKVTANNSHPDANQQLCRWAISKESALAVYVADKPQVAICVRLGNDASKARALFDDILKGDATASKRTVKGHSV